MDESEKGPEIWLDSAPAHIIPIAEARGAFRLLLRRPLGVAPVRARHVLGNRCVPTARMRTGMARHTDAFVQDLDRGVGDACLELLADEARRYGVILIGDLNVVVGREPRLTPSRLAAIRVLLGASSPST